MLSLGTECFVFQFVSKNLNIKIYRIIILPVVLYGFETWSFALREERRLSLVYEGRYNRGEWRKLHNEELNDLYSSPNVVLLIKSRRMGWAGHAGRMGESGGVYKVLVGTSEGKGALGRSSRRREGNIMIHFQEVGCVVMD